MWFSTKRATPKKTFGFYRVEILAALLNGVFLVIALYVFYEAYERFLIPQAVKADWMLFVAVFGLLANIASAWLLFGNRQQPEYARGVLSCPERCHWLGWRIVASIAIIDGISCRRSVYKRDCRLLILSSSWVLIRDAVDIFLEGTPSHVNIVNLQDNWAGR